MAVATEPVTTAEFEAMAEFRYQVRSFLRSADNNARDAGLQPTEYQFLLSLKRNAARGQASLETFSERLKLSSRVLIQVIEALVRRKLVERRRFGRGHPESFLHLTSKGEELLLRVALLNRAELRARARTMVAALTTIESGAAE